MGRASIFDNRLMMIGLDSLNRPFVERNSNSLPNIARILGDPSTRALQSSADIASASVWPSFVMGKNPGHHGHYFPLQFDPSVMHYRNVLDQSWDGALDYEPFWFSMADEGVRPVILDAGLIEHRDNMPGIHIVNWSYQTNGAAYSSPDHVIHELHRRFGKRPIGPEIPVLKNSRQSRKVRDTSIHSVRKKGDAILWLLDEFDWDFFLAGIFEIHRAGHNLWPVEREFASLAGPDDMLAVYAETDRQIGRILDAVDLDRTRIVFFSLSGMQINAAQEHFLPEILRRLNRLYLHSETFEKTDGRQSNLMAYLRSTIPPGIQYGLADLLGGTIQDWVVNRSLVSHIDWSQTPSFPVHTGGEGLIRFSLKGRERDGYFDPQGENFERYSNWLKKSLLDIRVSETGEPLISEVVDVQARYHGDRDHLLPDLCVLWAPEESVTSIQSDRIGTIRHKIATGRGGNHNGESFASFVGGPFNDDNPDEVRDIIDLSSYARKWFDRQSACSG